MSKPRQSATAKARLARVARNGTDEVPEVRQRVRVTPEILDDVLLRLEQGESLSGICNSDTKRYPRPSTITDLCVADEAFNVRYARARNLGIDRLAERGLAVASDDKRDPNSRRVELDAIKWFTGKMRPEKYGDASRLEMSGPGGGPISVQQSKLQSLSDDELSVLVAIQRKVTGQA